MNRTAWAIAPALLLIPILTASAQDARIVVKADKPGPVVSRQMTGVCIEDVNHEIYGGISSQMIFGESFQEPPMTPIDGFKTLGGSWTAKNGILHAPAGDGPKLIAERPPFRSGEVSVQVRFEDDKAGNAGLILEVSNAGVGADRFQGYEVSLNPGRRVLTIGRHRGNWEHIKDVPCEVPINRWITLNARIKARWDSAFLEVLVDGRPLFQFEDREHPLSPGQVGLRTWQREADFRDLTIDVDGKKQSLEFRPLDPWNHAGVSGMWRGIRKGSAEGHCHLAQDRPFLGTQSQIITFEGGEGSIGIENRGLNRQGMGFQAGKPYEGYLWARADRSLKVEVSLENGEGSRIYAAGSIAIEAGDWKRYEFALTPDAADPAGRFSIVLTEPGTVLLGHAFLQPGDWGRFAGLPVRKDVADRLKEAGVTVMRLGGLMINAEGYRWKKMIGPRDRRPPYKGFWYPHSSNGWGIFEFLQFCEAAGFEAIVDLNLDETPQDLADFVEYTNGPADSPWGKKRVEDGHPDPYKLKYIELGNEEAVDEAYWNRFRPIAEAVWAKDPSVILIVGDFEYKQAIIDPYQFEGAPRIKTLAAHKKILDLAREHGREVWFDVHIWNDRPRDARGPIAALATFDAALAKLSPGTNYKLCVLEENASNHTVKRAIAHGETINGLMRMGDRVRIVCAANALQVDGQNDNGWDQGLIFLNPTKAWIQPPGYITQMVTRNSQARVVEVRAEGDEGNFDVVSTLSDDGSKLVIQVANMSDRIYRCRIDLEGYQPTKPLARVEHLGLRRLDETNTADEPQRIRPLRSTRQRNGGQPLHIPPNSYTILRFE
ncbi:MAG: alpha-L-arabinofuranosidase C-terminal domain-containing protein [Isosphaeraceae bacterium]